MMKTNGKKKSGGRKMKKGVKMPKIKTSTKKASGRSKMKKGY